MLYRPLGWRGRLKRHYHWIRCQTGRWRALEEQMLWRFANSNLNRLWEEAIFCKSYCLIVRRHRERTGRLTGLPLRCANISRRWF